LEYADNALIYEAASKNTCQLQAYILYWDYSIKQQVCENELF